MKFFRFALTCLLTSVVLLLMIPSPGLGQSLFSERIFDLYYNNYKVATLNCDDEKNIGLNVILRGVHLNHPLSITHSRTADFGNIAFGKEHFPHKEAYPIQKLAKLCDGFRFRSKIELSFENIAPITETLKTMFPVCEQVRNSRQLFVCEEQQIELKEASQKLERIRQTVVRWPRQPYFLLRRIEVTQQVIADLEQKTKADVCALIKNSLPLENPFSFRSANWQLAYCGSTTQEQKKYAGMVGVRSAFAEIDFLAKVAAKETITGVVRIRIPTDQEHYTRKLWVKLAPDMKTKDAFYEFTNLQREEHLRFTGPWHPLYGVQWHPGQSLESSQTKVLGSYVWDSLMSETEFLVSNGRSKMLRMPAGRYHYSAFATTNQPFGITKHLLDVGMVEWKKGRSVHPIVSKK